MPRKKALLNRSDTAAAMGVNVNTLTKWCQDGCPAEEEGGQGKAWKFDPDKVKAWRAKRLSATEAQQKAKRQRIAEMQGELDEQPAGDRPEEQLSFKAREEYYRAEARRMEVDKRRGQLCEAGDVRRQLDETLNFLSGRLQSLPDFLERRCSLTPEVVDEVVKAVDDWQGELARLLSEQDLADEHNAAA